MSASDTNWYYTNTGLRSRVALSSSDVSDSSIASLFHVEIYVVGKISEKYKNQGKYELNNNDL